MKKGQPVRASLEIVPTRCITGRLTRNIRFRRDLPAAQSQP